jgi:hypothetical protein
MDEELKAREAYFHAFGNPLSVSDSDLAVATNAGLDAGQPIPVDFVRRFAERRSRVSHRCRICAS